MERFSTIIERLNVLSIVDIVLVVLLLYYFYKWMKASHSANIFVGILFFIITWFFVTHVFEMRLLGGIMDQLINVGTLALVVLFQDEIRYFLSNLGNRRFMDSLRRFFGKKKEGKVQREEIMPIVMACLSMSKQHVGALIVIEGRMAMDDLVDTGDRINADIDQRLIENIFFKNSPLHDGAMIISKKRIKAAGCILPVSHDNDIPKALGLRHRAALGISQKNDSLTIIISEETGNISIAHEGKFNLRLSAEELERALTEQWEIGV